MARGAEAQSTPAAVQIELLNTPRLLLAEREPITLERKDAALLALLAIDGPSPRLRIAAMLWPGSETEAARSSLRQRLFRMRKAVGSDVVVGDAILCLAESVASDVMQLHQRLAVDAEALRGDLLGSLGYDDCEELHDWVDVAREQWRLARRDAVAERAAQLESEGRLAEALRCAERLIGEEPLLEHGHRRLMRLHYLRGDRGAALAAFERCRELLRHELRTAPGKETLELAALIERSGALAAAGAAAPRPVTLLRPPRLVGRDAEWRQLEAAVAARRPILVSGEAGMGKSRLLADFVTAHGGQLVGARPGDVRLPYSLLGRLLRDAAPRFGIPKADWVLRELAPIAPELGPTPAVQRVDELRLRRAMVATLNAWMAAKLAIVALDDLHFADEATLELIPALASEVSLPWLLGARSGELPPALRRWLDGEESTAAPQLTLTPLDAAGVEALLESLQIAGLDAKRWASALWRHTGGNPLFILETLLALAAEGGGAFHAGPICLPAPQSVGALIARRLAQLSPPALKLAQVAALAGQDFGAALAAAVLKVQPLDLAASWSELEQAQVLNGSSFAHDLLQEAALKLVPQPIAQLLHGDVAAFLEQNGGAPARIAQHYLLATQWAKAGEHFLAAAQSAAALGRNDEQTQLLEQAAECFSRAGDSTNAVLALADLANAHLTFSRFQRAWAAVERARAAARSAQEKLWCLDVAADIHNNAREHEQALACATEALALATELGDEQAQFNAARKAAGALGTLGRYEESLRLYDAQRDWAARHEQEADVLVYLCDRGYLLEQAGRSLEAVDAYRSAIAAARRAGDLPVENAALTNLAVTHWRLGQYEPALACADEATALRLRLGGGDDDGHVDRLQRAAILRDLGRYDGALPVMEAVLPLLRAQGSVFWSAAAEDHLALLFVLLGQPARAGPLLATPADASAAARAHRLTLRARLERLSGRDGLAIARQAVELVAACGPVRLHLLAQLETACALVPDQGAALALEVAERARARQSPGLQAHALYRASQCLLDAGERERSSATLRQAREKDDLHLPFGMYTPEKDWIAYRVLATAADATAAGAALRAGCCWVNAALGHVPAEFRDSFLHRNPVNRALLTAAARLRIG